MLTRDEAELYDRQIRLWGVGAQTRIRRSKVLMLGFNGVASEVAKILVLAGIDTLTIVDDKPLQETDLTSNLFCRPLNDSDQASQTYRTHAVGDKLKRMNPLVEVNIDNSPILSKKPEEFKGYDLVTLHSFLTIDETCAINDICRANAIKFYIVLDYGFFGFMFNDLGAEFKFSYEEFSGNSTGEEEQKRQSGEAKDPISFEEDADGANDGSSDEENTRPTKKRRIYSPGQVEPAKKSVENEKESKVGSLPYVTFGNVISLKDVVFGKQTSPILLVSIAMFKFYSQFKYLPRSKDYQVDQDDISNLNKIIVAIKDSLNLDDQVFKRLDSSWSNNIQGSLSPVCAVLGGIAGQDMIRALSNKDIPINNTFSFDGLSMNGIVEKIGVNDAKCPLAKPVVRDFVQIDDDDDD